jgi:TolB protein
MVGRLLIRNVYGLLVLLGVQVTTGRADAQPIVVNIDNPAFRKLVVAVPEFRSAPGAAPEMGAIARQATDEFVRLLNFTGLFSVVAADAYRDLAAKVNASLPFNSAESKDLQAVDPLQWKALGIESLTLADVSRDTDGFILLLRTYDINKREVLLSRKFARVKREEITRVVRRYADLFLTAYTGRQGIFSSKMVFVGRVAPRAEKQIYIADFDGSNARAITSEKCPHISPAWSPDGRYVTYTSYEDGNPDLFIYDLVNNRKKKIAAEKGLNNGAEFSPSGKIIALTGSVEGDANIYVMSPSGGERRLLISGDGLDVDPSFSPDGKYLAFVSGRFGNPHIFRAKLQWNSDTEVRVIEDKRLTYAGWYNAYPSWSPDSDRIVFSGYDKDIDRFDLFMMNPDGTKLERLTLRAGVGAKWPNDSIPLESDKK